MNFIKLKKINFVQSDMSFFISSVSNWKEKAAES
jgi:hypothetical protein